MALDIGQDAAELTLVVAHVLQQEVRGVHRRKRPGDGVAQDRPPRCPGRGLPESDRQFEPDGSPALLHLGEGKRRLGIDPTGRHPDPDAKQEDQRHGKCTHAVTKRPRGRSPVPPGFLVESRQDQRLHQKEVLEDLHRCPSPSGKPDPVPDVLRVGTDLVQEPFPKFVQLLQGPQGAARGARASAGISVCRCSPSPRERTR
jgi:hypothetical protein